MPYEMYVNTSSDKNAVIFDIGTDYTKIGFSGEISPRAIIPSLIKSNNKIIYLQDVREQSNEKDVLINFLYDIYYRKLLISPKDRRIVIVENVLDSSSKRDVFANVLFKHYEIPSILFVPLHLVALFSLGLQSGVTVDMGYQEASVIPVFAGHMLLHNWEASNFLGAKAIENNIYQITVEKGYFLNSNNQRVALKSLDKPNEILTRDVLEDIKVRICLVTTSTRAKQWKQFISSNNMSDRPNIGENEDYIKYPSKNKQYGDICIEIPYEVRELSFECLFDDSDELNLPQMIHQSIVRSPIDCREQLFSNLLIVGGTASVKGLSNRLLHELKLLNSQYKLHDNLPGNCNYLSWLGGAIFGHLDSLGVRSITREQYLENGSKILDWTDNFDKVRSSA